MNVFHIGDGRLYKHDQKPTETNAIENEQRPNKRMQVEHIDEQLRVEKVSSMSADDIIDGEYLKCQHTHHWQGCEEEEQEVVVNGDTTI